MKGLSSDIRNAVEAVLDGLEYKFEVETIDSDKLSATMKSKTEAFKAVKDLLNKWQNSPNAPSDKILHGYIQRLVDAGDSSIDTLRDALSAKIRYDELSEDKHAAAIKAKGVIYTSISEINAGLTELRLQLESGEINLTEREFKLGFAEKYASGEFYPLSNYYKNWNNEEEDAVCICPNGTRGEIIEVDGLKIQLPEVPKEGILFSDLPKEEQYWRRTEVPKGLSKETAEEYMDFIMEEFRRRREGVWFMNNGVPTYLTGTFYFTLSYCKMEDNGGYMDFRQAQCKMSYHTEACQIDPRCLGKFMYKSRRTGFTYEMIFKLLEMSTSRRNFRGGITSKTGDDAEAAFKKYTYAYRNLPFFFQPVLRGSADSNSIYEFAKPTDRSRKSKKEGTLDDDLYLNTRVDWKNTTNSAYDSEKLNFYLGDEALKWQSPNNYISHWKQVSPTMDEGGVIVGKAWLGSTMGKRGKGGEVIDHFLPYSNPQQRGEDGRTDTGLYGMFLPAHENSRAHTDKYGICHKEAPKERTLNVDGQEITIGSTKYYTSRRKKAEKQGREVLGEEKRTFPMSIRDLLDSTEALNSFNQKKINDQIIFNSRFPTKPYQRGDFKWEGGIRGTKVVFYPKDNGRWLVSWNPPEEDRSRYETRGTVRFPTRNFCKMGIDPFESSVVMEKGSNGAGTTILESHWDTELKMSIVCHYLYRPSKIYDFYEDMLKQAVYYSSPVLCENNKSGFVEWMLKEGWGGFLMQDPLQEDPLKLRKGKKGVAMTSARNREAVIQVTESYIEDHIGIKETGEWDEPQAGTLYFYDILKDWQDFNPEKWTPFDSFVSAGLAILATKKPVVSIEQAYTEVTDWLPKFNNSGNISRRL